MRMTRRAEPDDRLLLQELYLHLNPKTPKLAESRAREIWTETLAGNHVGLFVTVVEARIVATCLLITAPNLMRGGAPHALLENVVTHRDYRRQGHGRATIGAALDEAWSRGCHQVLLVTGRGNLDPFVLGFYESCGFAGRGKAGLVALRPARAMGDAAGL